MRRPSHLGVVAIALAAAILAGCSRTTDRVALEGIVACDGAPMPDGSIVFIPQGDTKSPTCGGTISQGRFTISAKDGAAPGAYRVEITALRNTGKRVTNPRDGTMIDEIVQYVPPQFNRQSTLTATVDDRADNRFEFAITSK